MMKFFQTVLVLIVLSILATSIAPWWTVALVAFFIGALSSNFSNYHFLSGFLGIGLGCVLEYVYLHWRNDGILLPKMAQIFSENLGFSVSSTLLIFMAFLVNGVVGGMASWSGSLLPMIKNSRSGRRTSKGQYKINIQ